MSDEEMRALAEQAIAWSAANGVVKAGLQIVIGRHCDGQRARVAPGLMADVVCCEANGTRVLLDAHEVLRWLDERAKWRAERSAQVVTR